MELFQEYFSNTNATTHCNIGLNRIATLGDKPLKEAVKKLMEVCSGVLENAVHGANYNQQCHGTVILNPLGYNTLAEIECVDDPNQDQNFIDCLCRFLSTGGNDNDYRLALLFTLLGLLCFALLVTALICYKIGGFSLPSWVKHCPRFKSSEEKQELKSLEMGKI